MATVSDVDQWLAQYRTKIAGVQQATEELRENIAASGVTASSPDGAVTVTIAPGGGLRDLKFSHRAGEHTYVELAALVMKTVAKGQREMAGKVADAFEPIGAGTTAMEMLTSLAPEDEAEEELPSTPYDDLAADAPAAPPAPTLAAPAFADPAFATQPAPMRSGPMPPAPQPPAPVRPAPSAGRPRPARHAAEDDEFDERPW